MEWIGAGSWLLSLGGAENTENSQDSKESRESKDDDAQSCASSDDFVDAQSDAEQEASPASASSAAAEDVPQLPAGVPTGSCIIEDISRMRSNFPQSNSEIPCDEAVTKCKDIMATEAPPFFAFTRFLAQDEKHAIWTLFGVCHTFSEAKTYAELDGFRKEMRFTFRPDLDRSRLQKGSVWQALRTAMRRYPVIQRPFEDYATGVEKRPAEGVAFGTLEEMLLYVYRTAGVVGLIALPVLADEAALSPDVVDAAVAMGMALRLTDMLNCVGHHFRTMGLNWIPSEMLTKHGIPLTELESNLRQESKSLIEDERWRSLMRGLLALVPPLLRRAARGGKKLSAGGRIAVRAAVRMCSRMVSRIEARGYNSLGPHEEMFTWRLAGDIAGAMWDNSTNDEVSNENQEGL